MATNFFSLCLAPMITLNHTSTRENSRFVVMCSKNHVSLQTRSSHHKNKVFEDGWNGIVCYKDENGEITCEGYDEGPRFHYNTTTSMNVEIIELLQRCWVQVADGETQGN